MNDDECCYQCILILRRGCFEKQERPEVPQTIKSALKLSPSELGSTPGTSESDVKFFDDQVSV